MKLNHYKILGLSLCILSALIVIFIIIKIAIMMKAHEEAICTMLGLTIGGWVKSLGGGIVEVLFMALLTGFCSFFGTQFAKYVWRYLTTQFKK